MQRDTYNYLLGNGVDPESATTYVFLIYTPPLFLISWVLEIIIDRPAKDFAGELDRCLRRKRPKPVPYKNEKGELVHPDEQEFYGAWEFWKRNWRIVAFAAWLLFIFVFHEIYNSAHDYKA